MSETAPRLKPPVPVSSRPRAWSASPAILQTGRTRAVCLAIFVVSVAVMLLWRLFIQLEAGDSAIWDYIAQSILRGQTPYRDVVEIKGPASAYLSAFAMWLGKSAGFRDVMAVRIMQILLGGVLCTVTFLIVEAYLRSRAAALIAGLFPLMSYHFVSWTEGGTQPKLTMILFGMVSLLMIAKDAPLLAGAFSMLSCLCWQPGLLFTGVAILTFSRYLTSWRDRRAIKVVLGAMIPLAVTVFYFYLVGGLTDFWTWTVAYNFEVYAPEGIRNVSETLAHIWTVLIRVFNIDIIWSAIGLAGLLIFTAQRLKFALTPSKALKSATLYRDALVIAPITYLGFCAVNLQSGPDLIPLFPFIGIYAGWFIAELPRLLKKVAAINRQPFVSLVEALPSVALLLVLAVAVFRASTYKLEEWTLRYQEEQLGIISGLLGPDDQIYVHGAVEILVLLNRPNLNPYIMWDHGKAGYIAAKKFGGSVNAMVDAIEAEKPKLVAVSRLRHVAEGVALERWLAALYEELPIRGYQVFLRKQTVADRCQDPQLKLVKISFLPTATPRFSFPPMCSSLPIGPLSPRSSPRATSVQASLTGRSNLKIPQLRLAGLARYDAE
ncbi:MAG: DolP-mannose mannosyltransferase [Blastocatellia bacterium]